MCYPQINIANQFDSSDQEIVNETSTPLLAPFPNHQYGGALPSMGSNLLYNHLKPPKAYASGSKKEVAPVSILKNSLHHETLSSSDGSDIVMMPSLVSTISSPSSSASSRISDCDIYQKRQFSDSNNNPVQATKSIFEQENRILKKYSEMKEFIETSSGDDDKRRFYNTTNDSCNSNLNNNSLSKASRNYLRSSAV